jgi:hypothetical protein
MENENNIIENFIEYQKEIKTTSNRYLFNKLEQNEILEFSIDPFLDFIITSFSENPEKTEYFVSYTISFLDKLLIESYNIHTSVNGNETLDFINNPINKDLMEDINFNLFNGDKIKEQKIEVEKIVEIRSLSSRLSIWGYLFYNFVEFLNNINELYCNKYQISFYIEDIYEVINSDSDIKYFGLKNLTNVKKSKNQAKEPTNKEKLKALTVFCPELIQKLHRFTKEEKEDVIHLITGVNKVDSYKLLFTSKKREIDSLRNDTIENLKNTFN